MHPIYWKKIHEVGLEGIFTWGTHPTCLWKNGAVHTTSTILKHVVTLEEEAEYAGLFFNTKVVVTLWIELMEIVHPQPITPV